MNYAEQISAFETKRAALVAANVAIMEKAATEGETLDAAQKEEFDNNEKDVAEIDDHLKRLKAMEELSKSTAAPVNGDDAANGTASREGRIQIKTQPKLPQGIEFARLAKVKAVSRLDGERPLDVARAMYGENSNVFNQIKAPVAAGTTVDGNWASELVSAEGGPFADFVEYLRPATIIGKFGTNGIPPLRSVPHNRRLVEQTGGGAGYWVGEGKPKPLTSFNFNGTTLDLLKVANIAVLSEEVIRDSSPAAEAIVRDSLRDALVARLDEDFIDPAKAASAGVSPASITFGAQDIAATSYSDENDIDLDVRSVFQPFINANNAPTTGVWIMSASNALALSMIKNPLGQYVYPGINMNGGVFAGLPAIVSEYAGSIVVLVNASDVYLVDGGGVSVDMSREASLEMLDSGFTQAQPTGSSLVSMFQNNLVALRAERAINWARRRTSSVVYLTGVEWGGQVNTES